MKLIAAPLQGFTEAPWRRFHALLAGGADEYYAPFARVDHGAPRAKEMRDISSPLNSGLSLVPQVIARDAAEFAMLADAVAAAGHSRVDLNLGCPFPPQTAKGRGAGLLVRHDALADISRLMHERPGMTFSVKMRPGLTSSDQWRQAIDIINGMPLECVTVHSRIASQQYSGSVSIQVFREIADACRHPVVWNGDISTPDEIAEITDTIPGLSGVMAGRGLLARPTLFREYREGRVYDSDERLAMLRPLHDALLGYFRDTLCGEAQTLAKIKPFWEYFHTELSRKLRKAIAKSRSMASYDAAVANVF